MRADNDRRARDRGRTRVRRMLDAPDVRALRDPTLKRSSSRGSFPATSSPSRALLDHGTLHVLAIFDKPDPLDGPFFEETIYVTPSRASGATESAMHEAVSAACRALGLAHGPIHAECRVAAGVVHVLEVAARPIGGLCAGALRFARHARRPDPARRTAAAACREASVATLVPRDGRLRGDDDSDSIGRPLPGRRGRGGGPDRARRDGLRITAKLDQQLVPLPEGASYLGFIFARAAEIGRRRNRAPRGARAAAASRSIDLFRWCDGRVGGGVMDVAAVVWRTWRRGFSPAIYFDCSGT